MKLILIVATEHLRGVKFLLQDFSVETNSTSSEVEWIFNIFQPHSSLGAFRSRTRGRTVPSSALVARKARRS